MNLIADLLPGWVIVVLLILVIAAFIYVKVVESDEEPAYDPNRAITVGTFRVWVDVDSSPDDPRIVTAGKKIRGELDSLLKTSFWFHGVPHVHFVRTSRGSIVFDYAIFILVTGATVASLKDYKSMRDGLKAMLEDLQKVRQALYRVSYRVGSKLSKTELRLVSDAEFEEAARKTSQSEQPRVVELETVARKTDNRR